MFSESLFSAIEQQDNKKDVVLKPKKKSAEDSIDKSEVLGLDQSESKKQKIDYGLDLDSLENSIPKTVIHNIFASDCCLHEVAVPNNIPYTHISTEPPSHPAKEYPFVLDPFQNQAILCLENKQSVLVSAHTSAGKTVVAEYAVALSLKARQRVIYTTPIKALSNQKYRQLLAEFVDVGLMTGDVSINPTASCLVMTTEILRNMLYRGSEVMAEAAWVIFDEIHYMRDQERGVVWEECIILLPDNIHYIFLSATIPNARQFAEWISHVHKQPCHVVYTEYRPTPLQHYIYPAGGDGIHLVLDEDRKFREDNFAKAMKFLVSAPEKKKNKTPTKGNFFSVVKMAKERNLTPIIVFSFSKKECEAMALQVSKLDFNSSEEKDLVEIVFNNAIDTLSDEDKKLPQLGNMLPLLIKGIGIHHSGLLPLLKEIVEILFAEGLIKVLVATETFSMGLNMPARTVLFSTGRKFDGKEFRWLTSGEYIQMSGRAGRRGLDERGIVILMMDESMSPEECKKILCGQPASLDSAYHLTYVMILNMLRVEGIEPDYMLKKSFMNFQHSLHLPSLLDSLEQKEKEIKACEMSEDVLSYCKLKQQLTITNKNITSYIIKPKYILPFLLPGRLIRVVPEDVDFGWGVVVNMRKTSHIGHKSTDFILDTLLHLSSSSSSANHVDTIAPCTDPKDAGSFQVVPVNLAVVCSVSSVCLYVPTSIVSEEARNSLLASLKTVKERFDGELPLLDPISNMHIKDADFLNLTMKLKDLKSRMERHPLHKQNVDKMVETYEKKEKLEAEEKHLKQQLRSKRNTLQDDQLKRMKRLLRRMLYVSPSDVVEIKGRVACEITTADLMVTCELLFNGTFNKLTAAEVCCLMSCLNIQEKGTTGEIKNPNLLAAFKALKEAARNVARVSGEVGLKLIEGIEDPEEYVESFRSHMMPVVEAWCNGKSFAEVCKSTTVFEGGIIRCIRRLAECLRQLWQAAKVMGNQSLEEKFQEGIKLIKRDIVFASSLYL